MENADGKAPHEGGFFQIHPQFPNLADSPEFPSNNIHLKAKSPERNASLNTLTQSRHPKRRETTTRKNAGISASSFLPKT